MQTFVNILLTLLIFIVIILIHEFGHFITAKLCGVKVNEFAIGMGPTLFRKKGKETTYSVRAFPIGGFVSMEGEESPSDDARAFNNQNVWKRILIICAGAIMNVVLGYLVLVGMTCSQSSIVTNTLAEVNPKVLLAQSGLQAGDTILKVNGRTMFVTGDISYELMRDPDQKVSMVVRRDGEKITLDSVRYNTKNEGGLGIKVQAVEKTFLGVVTYSAKYTACIARLIWVSLVDLVTGQASFNDLSGPVGMTQVVGEVAKVGWPNLVLLLAFITINVGIFNLLPIRALDGGRLLFLLIEAIRGKAIKPEYEGYIHMAGFIAVILLMIAVTFNDILKLFRG